MRRKKIRNIRNILLLILGTVILYLVIGAVVPFIHTKSVQDTSEADELVLQAMTDRESPDRAQILETNRSAWEERLRLIAQAREEIVLVTFDMRQGESTSDILAALYKKAEEGVHVRILVDGISGFVRMRNVALFETVAAHENIEIRLYNELNPALPWKSMGCMHDKYVIADHMAYILGGRNTFDYFIGDYPTNGKSFDREILIYNTEPDNEESSVYALYRYFEAIWKYDECKPYEEKKDFSHLSEEQEKQKIFLKERYEKLVKENAVLFGTYDYLANTSQTKGVTLLSNETHIYAKEPVLFYELTQIMKQAEHEVILHTPYVVLDDWMEETLSGVCQHVPVTMMVNARENGDNLVASSDYTYHRKDVLDTGVSLLEYMGGISYHGKSIVIDDNLSIIGSYNLDMRSTYVDTELMLAVRGEETAAQCKSYMEELHQQCRLVKADGTEVMSGDVQEQELPLGRRMVFCVLGFIMQAFRVFV